MDEDFGASYISIEDDEGNEFELEHLDTFLYKGSEYMVFLPADMEEDNPDYGLIILQVDDKDEEGILVTVDDDAVMEEVYNFYMETLYNSEDDE